MRTASLLFALLSFATITGIAGAQTVVKFGYAPWPGVTVKTEIASQILTDLGYKTSKTQVGSAVIILQSIGAGKLDVDMASWRPSENTALDPLLKAGKVTLVAANIKGAHIGVAVPDYVWSRGVHSLADLHKYGSKFHHRIYGIEAGNSDNTLLKKAVNNNTYDLHGWKVVPSSTSGMLTEVKAKTKSHQWIAFLAWAPHWMNIVYNIKYLKDPKRIFGKNSVVYTVANPGFLAKNPNVRKFLKQMVIPIKAQNKWIYRYGYKSVKAPKVARDWIKSNPKLIKKWLEGVTTADGKMSGFEAVEKAVK